MNSTQLKVTVELNNKTIFFNLCTLISKKKSHNFIFWIAVCTKVVALAFAGIQQLNNVKVRSFLSLFLQKYFRLLLLSKPIIIIFTITRIMNIVLTIVQYLWTREHANTYNIFIFTIILRMYGRLLWVELFATVSLSYIRRALFWIMRM